MFYASLLLCHCHNCLHKEKYTDRLPTSVIFGICILSRIFPVITYFKQQIILNKCFTKCGKNIPTNAFSANKIIPKLHMVYKSSTLSKARCGKRMYSYMVKSWLSVKYNDTFEKQAIKPSAE